MSIIALASNTLAGSPGAGQIEYNGQFYATDSNSSRGQIERITQATAVSASGTSVDFTGIPAWAKKITVMLSGVSFAAAGVSAIRLSVSNSLVTSGYSASRMVFTTTPANALTAITDGIASISTSNAATTIVGCVVLTKLTGNTWIASGQYWRNGDAAWTNTVGEIALAGTLDGVSIVATTSTFDAGTINILYEG